MKKYILTLALILVIFTPSLARAACTEEKVTISVNGLVCDFCARALEKLFGKREEVSGITVDLENGRVAITLKDGAALDDATLTTLVTDSGYNVTTIERSCGTETNEGKHG